MNILFEGHLSENRAGSPKLHVEYFFRCQLQYIKWKGRGEGEA